MRRSIFDLCMSHRKQAVAVLGYIFRQVTVLPGDEFYDPQRLAILRITKVKGDHVVACARSVLVGDDWSGDYTFPRRRYFGIWL